MVGDKIIFKILVWKPKVHYTRDDHQRNRF